MLSIRKGFTLVEILIVLALIGLFIAATSYLTHDSRIAQKNAERLADNINTTFRTARTNMVLGKGISSGSTLATTDKRVISIGSTGIKTTYGTTNTGTESNLPYPFYDGDTNYKITDISVSSGILINGQMPIWDHTGVTAADIIILKDGTIDITAALVATKINAIRITAGYEGFEQSVMLDRIMGRSEVVQGKGETSFIIAPLAAVNGECDNSSFFACTTGLSSTNNPGLCGGSATWSCLGTNSGTDDNCSKFNSPCAINGVCSATPTTCIYGTGSDNGFTTCGTTRQWTCNGYSGGTPSTTCSLANPACVLPPGTCGGSALSCTSGSSFVAGSDNGITCGSDRTWNCGGAGFSAVACSSTNPACVLPPGTCGGSALSCTSGSSFVAGSDNGITCGSDRTWNCGGAGFSAVACSSTNPACVLPPGTCGGSALSCTSGSSFVAGSDNGITCGSDRTWNCGGAGFSAVACSSTNPACVLPPGTCGGSALSCTSGSSFVAGSDNGITCGSDRTWNCGGAGFSAVACSSTNPACVLPPGTCGGSALSCTSGSSFVAGSDNGITCGSDRTWNCGGAGFSAVACSSTNPACVLPPGTCGGSALSCTSGSSFVAGSDNGITCGSDRTWNCGGAGFSAVACSSTNPACVLPPGTCGGSALSCTSGSSFVAGSDNGITCGSDRTWNCGGAGFSAVACSSTNPACALPACSGSTPCGSPGSCYAVSGCDNACGSTKVNDCAGTCGGTAVIGGCDNVCGSTKTNDCSGACGGSKVVGGCDNACGSTKVNDCAGTCGGTAVIGGCDNVCGSTKTNDCSGACGGSKVVGGCDNACGSTKVNDVCGVCGGAGNTCAPYCPSAPSGWNPYSCSDINAAYIGTAYYKEETSTCSASPQYTILSINVAGCTLAPINGMCGSSAGDCYAGNSNSLVTSTISCGSKSTWKCASPNGGTTDNCSIQDGPICFINHTICGGAGVQNCVYTSDGCNEYVDIKTCTNGCGPWPIDCNP